MNSFPSLFDSLVLINELCKDSNPDELYDERIRKPEAKQTQ